LDSEGAWICCAAWLRATNNATVGAGQRMEDFQNKISRLSRILLLLKFDQEHRNTGPPRLSIVASRTFLPILVISTRLWPSSTTPIQREWMLTTS
jgi:hypothetical protein